MDLDRKVMELEMRCKNKEMIVEEMKKEIERLRTNNFEYEQDSIKLTGINFKNQQVVNELEEQKRLLESQQKDMIVQQKEHYDQQQQQLQQLQHQQQPKLPQAKQRLQDITPISAKMKSIEGNFSSSKYTIDSLRKQLTSKEHKIKVSAECFDAIWCLYIVWSCDADVLRDLVVFCVVKKLFKRENLSKLVFIRLLFATTAI